MKHLVLGALVATGALISLAGCGSGDDGGDGVDPTGDGGTGIDAPAGPCDPIAPPNQQGCQTGQRCTWIVDSGGLAGDDAVGHVGCVVDGTLPLGAVCTPTTGGQPDRCTTGLICAGGTCQDICGFGGGADAGCVDGRSCARHANLFASGTAAPIAGACDLTCDPLTQQIAAGGSCPDQQACYLLTSDRDTVAVCAKAGTGTHDQDLTGPAFANACVAGAQPRRKNSASTTVQCGGLCKPVDVTSTMARLSEGGLAPDSCAVRWGAAAADDGGRGESCRYWSGREPFAALSPYSNTVGWCFKHVAFEYDGDGDGTNDSSFPRCAALTMADVVPPVGVPPHNDAAYFWCLAMAPARAPMITIPQVLADRVKD